MLANLPAIKLPDQNNVVKTKMQAAITSNDDIRSEVNAYNIIAAPGFPEMLDEMVALSTDRRNTAFVIADNYELKKMSSQIIIVKNRKQLDLLNQEKTEKFFKIW